MGPITLPSLTAKPHPFNGTALTPKHARELTPTLVLTISAALASSTHKKNATAGTGTTNIPSSPHHHHHHHIRRNSSDFDSELSGSGVQYTVWITEAWRILGWAEPSAALFWEMATMYHTLHVASRSIGEEIRGGGGPGAIPPILSCESASSVGSNPTTKETSPGSQNGTGLGVTPLSPSGSNAIFVGREGNPPNHQNAATKQNRKNAGIVAKELPVWLVGMFLLLHCEEQSFMRNVSGEDERRFDSIRGRKGGVKRDILQPVVGGAGLDVGNALHSGLSPRTRIHAGQHTSNVHLTAFILQHLRKFLLLSALPNTEALSAISSLSTLLPSTPKSASPTSSPLSPTHPNPVQILLQHDRDHSNIGSRINLYPDDLEKLSFVLHPPNGGLIEEPPIRIREYLFENEAISVGNSILLSDIERLLRHQLELDLNIPDPADEKISEVSQSMKSLQLKDKPRTPSGYNKELTYTNLHGRTTILKPSNNIGDLDDMKSNAGSTISNVSGLGALNGRLHDLTVSGCSDAHMYLLQPFENATISACTGCTIVIGAVAGLLHVVDCERTVITSAARRVLICNSFEVLNCVFTPSPPLLVGDNRSCQLAPYNTYYDGLREDLLTTGLAAAVIDHAPPPSLFPESGASPALQCASNKWKQPVELSKLEIPQVNPQGGTKPEGGVESPRGSGEGSSKDRAGDDTMVTPILQPASEFCVLFVPFESEAAKLRRQHHAAMATEEMQLHNNRLGDKEENKSSQQGGFMEESQYCRNLADLLQLSPFRLPVEYERRVLVKAERMRSLQQAMQTDLTPEQQLRVEDELNKEFRDWLVTSGNLRQVLDLVRMEKEDVQ